MSKNVRLLRLKWPRFIGVVVVLLFALAQFFRPQINNPPLLADHSIPNSVKSILRSNCYNCHSHETRLSWFDRITPVNFLVASDIRNARQVVNFSTWDYLQKDRQKAIFFECLNQMQFREMPLWSYSLMHVTAANTPQKIASIQSYVSSLLISPRPDSTKNAAWKEQYSKWISGDGVPFDVKNAPNGIVYIAGIRRWGMISFSEHLDDDWTRLVLGNQTAMDAIRQDRTNPWPDGSILAKIAWFQTINSEGLDRQGAFKQVVLMIKDKNKYKSTLG